MNYACGSILTPRGRISVALQRFGDKIEATLTVPDAVTVMRAEREGYSIEIERNS
jgi:hypothetical protein